MPAGFSRVCRRCTRIRTSAGGTSGELQIHRMRDGGAGAAAGLSNSGAVTMAP
jgi:hypothetical protein